MKTYKVINENAEYRLEESVREYMALGWEIQGGYFFYTSGNLSDRHNHCQAMMFVDKEQNHE